MTEARTWLRRGVAGVYVPSQLLNTIASRSNFHEAVFLSAGAPHTRRQLSRRAYRDLRRFAGRQRRCRPARRAAGREIVDGTVNPSTWDAATLRTKLVLADSPAGRRAAAADCAAFTSISETATRFSRRSYSARAVRSGLPTGRRSALRTPHRVRSCSWTPSNLTKPTGSRRRRSRRKRSTARTTRMFRPRRRR